RLAAALDSVGGRLERLPLHPDKVVRIANRVRDQARRLRKGAPTDPLAMPAAALLALDERIAALQTRVEEGKLRLFRANLRLVVSIAKGYASSGMELTDLIQEGGLGLMKAIDKFKASKGFKLSTYATWWVRQAIQRAIADRGRTIHVPAHVQEAAARLRRIHSRFIQKHQRAPSPAEFAKTARVSTRAVDETLGAMQEVMSLEADVGREEGYALEDILMDTVEEAPPRKAEVRSRHAAVERWLETLNEREAGIVRMRFGLDSDHASSLEEVGRRYGITRERARQIQLGAMKKLLASPFSAQMRDYLSL
ncbi:MAG: sigma-70 family RNA polymerase sigma factor, partial [Elusimicrobia bacterium]|nr:sigma-70 family RNA polymerase sigma factor [Elusimicrobiota bacterium]